MAGSAEIAAAEIVDLLRGGSGRVAVAASLETNLSLIRQLIVPTGYGGLYNHEETAAQVIATGGLQKLTTWQNAGIGGGRITVDLANNRLVVATAGIYLVGFTASFSTSGAAHWTGLIILDGVTTDISWERNVGGPGGPGSAGAALPVAIAAGQMLEAAVEHDQAGDITFTHESGQLLAVRIG